ncbi:MAG: DUF4160 domain-containing protein [Actinobacteria bacterium]|nr:DUF4160 domain-containing protein [Actinomycetota bacterium]
MGGGRVHIDKIEVLESNLTRKQIRMACAWAALHQIEREENWQRARAGATLRSIEPWR